jgi:hypothetical protein
VPGFRLSYRYVNFVKKYGYLQVIFYYLLRQSVGLQHDQCQPPCPSTRLNSRPLKLLRLAIDRKYSEMVCLPTSRIASTSANANRLTGLPNTYNRPTAWGDRIGAPAEGFVIAEGKPRTRKEFGNGTSY